MADRSEDILEELKNISFLLGDLNAIRNGEYDPPTGSGSGVARVGSQATPNDIVNKLDDVVELLGEIAAEIRLVRQAVYGSTSDESGDPYQDPKHGHFGVVADSSSQIESYLSTIDGSLAKLASK